MKFNIFNYKDKKDLGCGVEPVMSSREDVHDPACVTHDYRYVEHDKPRKESDKEFLDNMLKINSRFKSGSMRAFLNARAYLWYGIVRVFGRKPYKD